MGYPPVRRIKTREGSANATPVSIALADALTGSPRVGRGLRETPAPSSAGAALPSGLSAALSAGHGRRVNMFAGLLVALVVGAVAALSTADKDAQVNGVGTTAASGYLVPAVADVLNLGAVLAVEVEAAKLAGELRWWCG